MTKTITLKHKVLQLPEGTVDIFHGKDLGDSPIVKVYFNGVLIGRKNCPIQVGQFSNKVQVV